MAQTTSYKETQQWNLQNCKKKKGHEGDFPGEKRIEMFDV